MRGVGAWQGVGVRVGGEWWGGEGKCGSISRECVRGGLGIHYRRSVNVKERMGWCDGRCGSVSGEGWKCVRGEVER